jgi:hypothetical protein
MDLQAEGVSNLRKKKCSHESEDLEPENDCAEILNPFLSSERATISTNP